MGSTASPEICDITLHKFEKKFLEQAKKIITWWRYRDDILVIFDGNLEDFKTLIDKLNQSHPTLKFTYEASTTSINYLDLTIFKGILNELGQTGKQQTERVKRSEPV